MTLLVHGELRTAMVSDEIAIEIDTAQYIVDEGPCLDAARTSKPVRVDAVSMRGDYERFISFALDAGVRTILSVPLMMNGCTRGSMNLYSDVPFDRVVEAKVHIAARHAATALAEEPTIYRHPSHSVHHARQLGHDT